MLTQLQNKLNKIEQLLLAQRAINSEFLSIQETSNFLKLKKSTIYQLVHKKGIPHIKRGKNLLFNKTELIEWLNESRVKVIQQFSREV